MTAAADSIPEASCGARWFPRARPRWCDNATASYILAALAIAISVPCCAEPLIATASFDSRFAGAAPDITPANDATVASAAVVPQAAVETPATTPATTALPHATDVATTSLDTRARYRLLIEKEAARHALAPEIAEAVMGVESGYNAGAIGGVGEIGLMQILPSTARMLGFAGSLADLAVPETNIHYGVTYLARAWRLAGGDLCTTVMKYRAGHGETRFSILSVNYCLAVRSRLVARGFPVTGAVPIATFGEPGRGGCGRKCISVSRIGTVNIAALNTRLSALVLQVRGGR